LFRNPPVGEILKGEDFISMLQQRIFVITRASVVVEALCYKPEGRGFETRSGE
jgi:hypothetical protein